MDGAFWFPRTLFGIQNHFLSFYDEPVLYHQIINDLADFEIRQMEKIYEICTPEFMTIAEDMSYNNGPMLSGDCFDEFLAPYYRRVVPFIRAHGTKVFVDTDGDVTKMIPWLKGVGIEGILPLERMAGVDVVSIREKHPDLLLMGAFDKTVMKNGEVSMRAEFERLLPVMKQGGFIPGVDHQTPPDVSIENFRTFVSLLFEYAEKAVH
jgi:uroporphyrinogen-III decarboxylase